MANPPLATPGTVIPSGALLTSGGTTGFPGTVGATGPTAASADAANTATLGSDAKIYVPAPSLASTSASGLLKQVSGSTRDLVDGTNNCAETEVRASWRKRYYYCWHCDHPPSASQYNVLTGAGSTFTQVASQANHPGIYQLAIGNVASASSYWASNSVADIQLNQFSKLAFRCVFNLYGAYSVYSPGSTAGYFTVGLVDTLNSPVPSNGIYFGYQSVFAPLLAADTQSDIPIPTPLGAQNFTFYVYASAGGSQNINVTNLTDNNWYEFSFYWEAATNSVKMRLGYPNGNAAPVSPGTVFYGPYLTGAPTTVPLYWTILLKNYSLSPAAVTSLVDLVEIVGEYATPGGFRGEELVTAF